MDRYYDVLPENILRVDIPKYTGPCFFPGHPTWVPIRPLQARHRRMKQWTRTQLPMTLAWGITIPRSTRVKASRSPWALWLTSPISLPTSPYQRSALPSLGCHAAPPGRCRRSATCLGTGNSGRCSRSRCSNGARPSRTALTHSTTRPWRASKESHGPATTTSTFTHSGRRSAWAVV